MRWFILIIMLGACSFSFPEVDLLKNKDNIAHYDKMSEQDIFMRAKSGDPEAQYRMGVRENSESKIYTWFCLAAKQGHRDAQYDLGTMLRDDDSKLYNEKDAYMWLSVAAAEGHRSAEKVRKKMAKDMDILALNDAIAKRRNWRSTSCVK